MTSLRWGGTMCQRLARTIRANVSLLPAPRKSHKTRDRCKCVYCTCSYCNHTASYSATVWRKIHQTPQTDEKIVRLCIELTPLWHSRVVHTCSNFGVSKIRLPCVTVWNISPQTIPLKLYYRERNYITACTNKRYLKTTMTQYYKSHFKSWILMSSYQNIVHAIT